MGCSWPNIMKLLQEKCREQGSPTAWSFFSGHYDCRGYRGCPLWGTRPCKVSNTVPIKQDKMHSFESQARMRKKMYSMR